MPRSRRVALPAGAVPASLPESLEPQLATLVDKPPSHGEWLYEIKFDGYRMLARVGERGGIRLHTRRGHDWTRRLPGLLAALAAAKLPPGWYDGEIVVLDAAGQPDFNALQNAIEGRANAEIVFWLFDAPFLDGHDLRGVGVEARRAALQAVLAPSHALRFSEEISGPASALLRSACELGLEGVIGKRLGSRYVHRRSDDWIKLKCVQRQEFVIGGYTWPDKGRRDDGIGALLVGTRAGRQLAYAGKVGTGFAAATSRDLRRRLDAIAQKQRPFDAPTGHDRHATWVRPEFVCEVTYSEWPEQGGLRHASFKGLREDKPAPSVVRERPVAAGSKPTALRITNPDRVVDPGSGLTKADLVRYYAEVAPWMLPHLRGRPAYIRRAPLGIGAPMTFQQHTLSMKGLKGTDPAVWPGHDPAIAFDTAEDLAAAAQLDMVEVHTWNSVAAAPGRPDRLVFDLDPGEGVGWRQLCDGARLVRALLNELGLQSWLKTTGGKGLHVFVPVRAELEYAVVKPFTEAVVRHLARTLPQLFVAKSGPRNRPGRIFIDYLRNGWVQSTAEALSARARPGLGVSMPVDWEQLVDIEGPAHWTVANAVAALRRRRRDPWGTYWSTRQRLDDAMERLGWTPPQR